MKKCQKCRREFNPKTKKQKYCTPDCRINDFRGTKSKWEKAIEILTDKEIHRELGVSIVKNSDG